jgi:magnesium transporter
LGADADLVVLGPDGKGDGPLTARIKRRYGVAVIIDTAVYADGRRTASETIVGAFQERHGPDSFACIVLHEPDREELGSLAGGLRVDQAGIEQTMQRPRRAGILRFENLLCVWLAYARYPSGGQALRVGWICVLLGEDLVVALSFGEDEKVLEAVGRRVENGSDRLWRAPWDVLREIVDVVFDDYDDAVNNLDDDIVRTEGMVFDGKSGAGRRIHALTRVVVELHQATEPLAEALDRLLESADAEAREVLNPARHRLRRVTEKLDGYRDLLSSLLSLNLTMVGQKISAWGAILIVPTLIAGVFGMNANTTYFGWVHGAYGFDALVAIMMAFSVVLYLLFKRSGWL